MPSHPAHTPADAELADALDAALDALQAGRPFDREALLARHPELGPALGGLGHLMPGTVSADCPSPVTPQQPPLPERVGPYRVERLLGAGGFGVVYLAHDPDVDRRVAVKLLHPDRIDQPDAVSRFHREAHATGRLRHPGIVQLFDYSRQDGPPYYLVTEYVEGQDPRAYCRERKAGPCDIAELVARLADAVEYAHQKGVCHRDLKPGNVLIDALGQPHVLDFGLARLQASGDGVTVSSPTAEGNVLGSLPYMPPEQASGQSHTADERSDVYSLGVILYELLTGRQPFQGPPHELLPLVLEGNPPQPRSLNPDVPPDLEAVCLMAMARRPQDRYGTAAALAEDLRAFCHRQPVRARRLTWLGRVRRVLDRQHLDIRRRGWGVLLIALGTVILAGCALCNYWQLNLPRAQAAVALMLTKIAQVALMLYLAWRLRPSSDSSPPPSRSGQEGSASKGVPREAMTAAERQIWSLVPGYYGGYLTLVVVNVFLPQPIPLAPVLAVLSGMGFCSLGSTIWGWFYVWALMFFALAVVIALVPVYGLTFLGLGWFACLVVGGAQLRWTR